MLIKTLEGNNCKVTVKLMQNEDNNGNIIFILERNSVDSDKNQKIKIDTLKNCSDVVDANNRFNNIVTDYISKGYAEKPSINQKVSLQNIEKPSFLAKVFKKFK